MASGTSQCTVHMTRDASTDTQDVAVVTDPDCLGPCEPGTQVTLEGIVWHESDNGVLVVNVTWRDKTYVGTLLDATKYDWAPPRINCDSPTVELESRTPKGRGKRRGTANTPVNDTRTLRKGRRGCSVQAFTAPPSPAKSDISTGGLKRKGKPQDIDLSSNDTRSKRSRSQVPTPNSETPTTDVQGYIECPEPNCNKKYRHANGLKYHQSHAHSNSNLSFDDAKEDMDTEDMPLSVMKNNVKKEKEALKKDNDTNKKDPAKDNSPGDKLKWDISELGSVSKAEQEESNNDDKEAGNNKNDQKFENINSAKKKDCNGSNAKVTPGQINSGNSVKMNIAVSSATKPSNIVALPPDSSQDNSNSVLPVASQILSTSSNLSSVSSLITVTASTSLSLSSISPPSSKPASPSLISSVVSVTRSETLKSEVKLVDIKPKVGTDMLRITKQNRPIVPAPSHTVVANVQVTHSNLSPVVSHTQVSPQLKPIQPKPTIMGEPQNVNQSLADLNKDRKKMQKKRSKEGAQNGSTLNRPEQPTIKIERDGVIKPNPIPGSSKQLCEQNRKDGSRSSDSQRSQTLASHSRKGADFSHSRGIQNPNLLKVGSPLQVHTPDNAKGLVTDDVQSPAYSDISDANESASPAALSDTSPQKPKEEPVSRKEEKREASPPQMTEGQMMPHYGMYPYYAQSQYNMNMSPGQKSSSSSSSGVPSQGVNTNLDNKSSSAVEKKNTSDEQKSERKQEEKESTRPKSAVLPMAGMSSGHMTPQQMQEYQMQLYHQQMCIQSLPRQLQYQYMANGWYPSMDMAYMQQMMEEQRQAQSEQNKGRSERDGAQIGQVHEKPCDVKSGHDSKIHGIGGRKDELCNISIKKTLISPGQNIGIDHRNDNARSHDDRNTQEQALRDKQSENHQILKENIDLKNEMDKNRQENERRQEELRRNMYQEQKKIEEKKKMDLVRKGESKPESVTPKAPGTKPLVEQSLRNFIPVQHTGNENVNAKRDINSSDTKGKESVSKDVSANKYSDSGKSSDEKSKTPVSEKNRADIQVRNPELLKQKLGCSSSKSCSPTSSISSSSIPVTPPYNIPYSHAVPYAYMQSPHFMGIDHGLLRGHSVNAAMLGGYPTPGYIHPSQMDYRPPVGDDEKDSKSSGLKSVLPTVDGCDIKKGDLGASHSPYYGQNVHKIHELTEKVRPKSRTSPVPLKSTDLNSSYEKHRDYTNSPPTQRHVHTHHHTHVLQPGPGLPAGPPLQAPGFSPVYDPYSAMFVSQTQPPHPFPPK